ncbi:OprP Phosphate-selective porin [Methylophilaceae bacterium]
MNFKLRSLVAATLTGSMLMGFGTSAMADSTDDILNALIAKGILTEEEGALLQKGRTGEKEAAAEKKKTAVSIKNKDGAMVLETGDGKNSMAVTGRLHFDARSVNTNSTSANSTTLVDKDSTSLADQFEIRRARIGVKGKMFEHFDYEVIGNLVGSNTNTVDVAYVNAGMLKQAQVKIGQFKQPFNLEEYGTSSNNIDFMERSYVNQLSPAKKPGFMLHGVPTAGITYAGSVYQQNAFGEVDAENTGKGFAGRVTGNLAELAGWKDSVFHVGVAGFDSEYGVTPTTSSSGGTATAATIVKFRTEGRGIDNTYRAQIGGTVATTDGFSAPSPNTASMKNKAYGLELAAAYGPFKIQGEFTDQTFDATAATNTASLDARAYYVEALWLLTGENYSDWYKNGAWGGIKPKSNFDVETGKGLGAWEIGLRFDEYKVDNVSYNAVGSGTNLNRVQGSSANVAGGSSTYNATGADGGAKTYTVGLKWQLTPNMRMLANYSHTKFDNTFTVVDTAVAGISHEDLLMLRSQFSF